MEENSTGKFNLIKLWINQNELSVSEDLTIIELIFKKYNLMRLKDFASANGLTEQGVLKRANKEQQPFVELSGTKFYF